MEQRPIGADGIGTDDEMIEFLRQSLKDADEGRLLPAREAIASLGKNRSGQQPRNQDRGGVDR
ncbi:MAG TPA: hypothetical protein VFW73_11925 [Lacipirellulaceae bacterium]|nr:hypothetical protein [Lacipirellulaceae bacterium]